MCSWLRERKLVTPQAVSLVEEHKEIVDGRLFVQKHRMEQVLVVMGMGVLDQTRFMNALEELKQEVQTHLQGVLCI